MVQLLRETLKISGLFQSYGPASTNFHLFFLTVPPLQLSKECTNTVYSHFIPIIPQGWRSWLLYNCYIYNMVTWCWPWYPQQKSFITRGCRAEENSTLPVIVVTIASINNFNICSLCLDVGLAIIQCFLRHILRYGLMPGETSANQ